MNNPFYNDIYEILQTAGDKGLPLGVIARQVYNRHAGLFNTECSYDKIYQSIRFFLWVQAGKPSSPFTQGAERGWYALNTGFERQMPILFQNANEDEAVQEQEECGTPAPPEQNKDGQLSLF